jgi:chromodomain-helicase-DNA-binding protein 1
MRRRHQVKPSYKYCSSALGQEDVRKIARGEIDARERAGLVPYRSLQFLNNKRPTCAMLKTDPSYLGRSVYDYPDLVIP